MKVHLYFNGTVAGHVDLDALMPDISKRFPDSKVSIDSPYFGLKEIRIKNPVQNIKLVKLRKDIDYLTKIDFHRSFFQLYMGKQYITMSEYIIIFT